MFEDCWKPTNYSVVCVASIYYIYFSYKKRLMKMKAMHEKTTLKKLPITCECQYN